MKYVRLLAILIAILGCSAQHTGNPPAQAVSIIAASPASLQAFQNTVYAFGNTYSCVQCHSAAVNPQWMNPDLATAYSFARNLLDVSNPTASPFATYVSNGHCNNVICENAANIPLMQDALLQWAAVEINQSANGVATDNGQTLANPPFVTPTMAISNPLPLISTNAPAVMRFDLSSLGAQVPALSNAILEISIEWYNSIPTTYKVFNPRIVGNTASVTFSGIHVYVRPASGTGLGTEDVNQGDLWYNITAIAAPVTMPSSLPTGPITAATPLTTVTLGVAVQSAADVITIGFASVQ